MEVAAAPSPANTKPTLSSAADVNEAHHPDSLSLSIVLSSLNHLTPPTNPPAVVPDGFDCCTCGIAEVAQDHMVVCDGCDRGFHLDCVRNSQKLDANFDEDDDNNDWMCRECVSNAVPCSRWPVGFKAKQNGTVSHSPPFFNGEAANDDVLDSRKHPPGDNSFGGDRFGVPVTYLNLHGENGFNFTEASHVARPCFQYCLEDRVHRTQEFSSIIGEVKVHPDSEVLRTGSKTVIGMQPQILEERYLQALREHVRDTHGALEPAWSVKFEQPDNFDEPHEIYCSPDGKTFRSMPEVARYLGLTRNRGQKRSDDHASPEPGLQLRRRKRARHAAAGTVIENEEALLGSLPKQESSSSLTAGSSDKFGNHVNVIEAPLEGIGEEKSKKLDDTLPVQLKDFFLLSCGKIDPRPAYHYANQIWPVGYKSCWHDKFTGSVFVCEVSDGGDCGPKFSVRRCSCSAFPIPINCSTVLYWPNTGKSDCKNEEKIEDNDEDLNIIRFLTERSPPRELDILSCLGNSCSEFQDSEASKDLLLQPNASCRTSQHLSSVSMGLRDQIGDVSVEGSSTSSAWRRMSETFNDIFHALYKESGYVRFFCEHVEGADMTHESWEDQFPLLAKFHGSSNYCRSPFIIQNDNEMQRCSQKLLKWLNQDRFGLDMEFVQELVEWLPGASACSRYVVCNERSSPTSSVMVGQGKLHIKAKDVGPLKCEVTDTLPEGNRPPRKQMDNDPVISSHRFPPGMPISSRLPPQCVGHVLEVQEFLCRFHEVLNLQKPLSFKELEEELIHPLFDGVDFLENIGGGYKESHERAIQSGRSSGRILSSSLYSGPVVSAESPHAFIPTATGALEEAVEAMDSFSFNRHMGCALTKVHRSLLMVLMSELQSRVVAVLDPKVDGESKPKRGRKKDVDTWITGKRAKFNLLPLNELTWPEMSRRYILAFLSMCYGLMDINIRENVKIFRCLQGDGGILCGSRTGVAGKEEDAKLLADAMNRIFHFPGQNDDILYAEEDAYDGTSSCTAVMTSDYHVPEWVKVLEPVKKLPTNVGARIRNRVNDALKLGPPEWAKCILEHSISKGVYKGNASGPTKRFVLQVIERVNAEIAEKPLHKPDRKRRKKLALISEIIMRKCRIVLRRAVAAYAKDDNRRKLINVTDDDDDEAVLESPAMVSRPLDFRIIDMRLANGAYAGSHEAFLEDVRELWNRRRTANSDKPSLVALANELSATFEELYEKEVVTLSRRLVEYSKSESLSVETKEEIEEILASMQEIPKASWEEGVCKVCGIDRDDNSCLLCDGCNAEYHTYCLNPPLARIPEGEWYCPSCAVCKCQVHDAPDGDQRISQELKKYNGEFTRNFLDSLAHLAACLDAREYWDLSADERAFLLKFLCDEALNSSLIRQHLEQSVDLSTNLHQKVRSLCLELKNLKRKEERFVAKAAKVDRSSQEEVGHVPTEEGYYSAQKTSHTLIKELHARTDQFNCIGLPSDEMKKTEDNDHPTMPSSGDWQGFSPPRELRSSVMTDCVLPIEINKLQTDDLARTSVRNEILHLQNRIASIERQLTRLSVRREFLGVDSIGRLYWAISELGKHCLVVNGNKESHGERMALHSSLENYSTVLCNTASCEGSKTLCPNIHNLHGTNPSCYTWVSYQSKPEVQELVDALQSNDPFEKKLIGAIVEWRNSQQTETHLGEPQAACIKSEDSGISISSTIAATFLQTKYGPLYQIETTEYLKTSKNAKAISERKMFRCACLEPVWPSRRHCFYCHKTFFTVMEFEGHTDCNRNVVSSVAVKSKKCTSMVEQKGENSESRLGERGRVDFLGASKRKCSGLGAGVIQFQGDAFGCPFTFEDICSEFLLENSNKELVKEIGLIGSNGIPSFIQSTSPYLDDPSLQLVVPPRGASIQSGNPMADHHELFQDKTPTSSNCAMVEVTGAVDAKKTDATLEQSGEISLLGNAAPPMEGSSFPIVSNFSSRPVLGKERHILRQLKINLLEMDAALPEEGRRPARARSNRRRAWCAFVKSAKTIYEIVQATVVFEDMIKSDYLKTMWYYWSSLSAAKRISTLSHLALRIYTLDAAIDYEKSPVSSSRTEKNKQGGKLDKKKMEAEI